VKTRVIFVIAVLAVVGYFLSASGAFAFETSLFAGQELINVTLHGDHKSRYSYGASVGGAVSSREDKGFHWEANGEFLKNLSPMEYSFNYGAFFWPQFGYRFKINENCSVITMGGPYLGYIRRDSNRQHFEGWKNMGLDFTSVGGKLEYDLGKGLRIHASVNFVSPTFYTSEAHTHPDNSMAFFKSFFEEAHAWFGFGISSGPNTVDLEYIKVSTNEQEYNMSRLFLRYKRSF